MWKRAIPAAERPFIPARAAEASRGPPPLARVAPRRSRPGQTGPGLGPLPSLAQGPDGAQLAELGQVAIDLPIRLVYIFECVSYGELIASESGVVLWIVLVLGLIALREPRSGCLEEVVCMSHLRMHSYVGKRSCLGDR